MVAVGQLVMNCIELPDLETFTGEVPFRDALGFEALPTAQSLCAAAAGAFSTFHTATELPEVEEAGYGDVTRGARGARGRVRGRAPRAAESRARAPLTPPKDGRASGFSGAIPPAAARVGGPPADLERRFDERFRRLEGLFERAAGICLDGDAGGTGRPAGGRRQSPGPELVRGERREDSRGPRASELAVKYPGLDTGTVRE